MDSQESRLFLVMAVSMASYNLNFIVLMPHQNDLKRICASNTSPKLAPLSSLFKESCINVRYVEWISQIALTMSCKKPTGGAPECKHRLNSASILTILSSRGCVAKESYINLRNELTTLDPRRVANTTIGNQIKSNQVKIVSKCTQDKKNLWGKDD